MKLAGHITRFVDFFYIAPLRRVLPRETFRYAFCGGMNLLFGWLVYYLVFNLVEDVWLDLGFVVMSPKILALFIQFPITFLTGFWLNRNVTFSLSPLKGSTQFFRYIIQVAGSFLVTYLFLKLFSEVIGIYPTVAKPIADLVTVVYSYLVAKFFTFRGNRG